MIRRQHVTPTLNVTSDAHKDALKPKGTFCLHCSCSFTSKRALRSGSSVLFWLTWSPERATLLHCSNRGHFCCVLTWFGFHYPTKIKELLTYVLCLVFVNWISHQLDSTVSITVPIVVQDNNLLLQDGVTLVLAITTYISTFSLFALMCGSLLYYVFPFRVKCCILWTSKEESTFHTYISVPVFIFSKEKDRGAADVKRKDDWGIKKSTHRQLCGLSGTLTVSLIVLLQNTVMQAHSQKVLKSVPAKAFAVLHPCLFFSAIFGDKFVSAFGSMSDVVILAHMNECRVESWQKSRSHLFSMLDCLISLWLRAWCDRAGQSGSALNPDRTYCALSSCALI